MKLRHLIIMGLMLALLVPAAAQAAKHDEPGYLDLEWITIPAGAAEVQDIDLSDILVGIAADAERSGDTALAQALSMVHSVRVKAFSMEDGDVESAEKAVQKFLSKLEKDGWSRLIYVKNDSETVSVSTKSVDGKMVGLTVVVFDPSEEAAFINVAGDLNLGTIFQLAKNFPMEDLDAILDESKVDHSY